MLKNTRAAKHKRTLARVACALAVCGLVLSSWSVCVLAQTGSAGGAQPPAEQLFSPSVGQKFYEIAYEMANSNDLPAEEVKQAIIFLSSARNLDGRANYVLPEMIKLACRGPVGERAELVAYLLTSYVSETADLEVIRKAVSYVLEELNSREERENTIKEMLENLGGKNRVLDSELATLLGLLMVEKADLENAQFYLMQAYNSNKYNKLAFAKLAELAPEQVGPAMYLEYLRLGLRENPLDMETALAFAQYGERLLLYETAAKAYEYCADLFRFLYPSEVLPAYVYLPWAISSYNAQGSQNKCLQIASDLRQSGRFDLLLEAIAGKAAARLGDEHQANQILGAAEEKALANAIGDGQVENYQPQAANYEQLAWFYCFALPDANKALEWANKAYSTERNSANAAAILAYSLVMNGQTNLAKTLIDNYEQSQIAALTLAQIQLSKGQQNSAIEMLKSTVEADPGSLVAEHAKQIMAEQGLPYSAPIDPNIVLTLLKNSFGTAVVPTFVSPDKVISVQLNLSSSEFYYGGKLDGTVAITNNSAEPLIISDGGLFKGNIRVGAKISGDLDKEIPNLVSVKIRPALPVEPGRSILIPVRLVTGELRRILFSCPQASLDIEFTVYLDPVTTAEGKVTNNLPWVEPVKVVVKRPGVKLSRRSLQNRLSSLSKGREGQKIRSAELFTGLLMEQRAMANRAPLYKFKYADWMPTVLKSALAKAITDNDWTVRVHTMAGMVSLPLDYELMSALAENLNDTHWPARLMAVFLLAKSQGNNFRKVLDSTAKYDSNEYVRRMAVALGGTAPQQQQKTQPAAMTLEETADGRASQPSSGSSRQ